MDGHLRPTFQLRREDLERINNQIMVMLIFHFLKLYKVLHSICKLSSSSLSEHLQFQVTQRNITNDAIYNIHATHIFKHTRKINSKINESRQNN